MGTSPHTWRKLEQAYMPARESGNISTCMEKTEQTLPGGYSVSGHLRVCGENVSLPRTARFLEGTSPRVWRKLDDLIASVDPTGDISRYVEKTFSAFPRHPTAGISPHARRKPMACAQWGVPEGDISAHTRRKPGLCQCPEIAERDISAYAEKTDTGEHHGLWLSELLRIRGENKISPKHGRK